VQSPALLAADAVKMNWDPGGKSDKLIAVQGAVQGAVQREYS